MAKVAGRKTEIYWDDTKIPYRLDLGEYGNEHNAVDASDADGPASLVGQAVQEQLQCSFNYDPSDVTQQAIITAEGDDTPTTIEIRPDGTGTGKQKWTNTAVVLKAKPTAPVNGVSVLNVTFGTQSSWTVGTQA